MSYTDFAADRIAYHKRFFDPKFEEYFTGLKTELDLPEGSLWSKKALELLQKFSLAGGKRQRVAFMYEACGLIESGEEDVQNASNKLWTAISIELLQSHLLIHDDIIDESELRRGQPTVHITLTGTMNTRQARSVALLAGDISAYLAINSLLNANGEISNKLISAQLNAGIETFWGQIFDLERDSGEVLTKQQSLVLADYKAVRSSTYAPMLLGLILASSDTPKNIARIREFAFACGIAGQLQDDYLSIFGDSKVTGKSVLTDIKEGKRTLMVTHTLSKCDRAEKRKLDSILGNDKITNDEAKWCRDLFKKYKADDMIRSEAFGWAKKAKNSALNWSDWNQSSVKFFVGVAEWFAERNL